MKFVPLSALAAVLFTTLIAAPQKDTLKATKRDPEPKYDAGAVVDLIVTIEESRVVTRDPLKGRHLLVTTEKGALDVYLAPTEFLQHLELPFFPGQRIHIIGCIAKVAANEVMLAREVRWDNSSLLLRDRQGEPIWKSWIPQK